MNGLTAAVQTSSRPSIRANTFCAQRSVIHFHSSSRYSRAQKNFSHFWLGREGWLLDHIWKPFFTLPLFSRYRRRIAALHTRSTACHFRIGERTSHFANCNCLRNISWPRTTQWNRLPRSEHVPYKMSKFEMERSEAKSIILQLKTCYYCYSKWNFLLIIWQ